MKRLILSLFLLVLTMPVWAQGGQTPPPPRLLTVTGDSLIPAQPDEAVVQLGLETQAKTLQAAQDENAKKMTRVIQQIKALGVPENQIRTSSFSVYPVRETVQNPGNPPTTTERLVGYRVTNVVTVRLTDLSQVGRVVDTALSSGANRVDNVSFTIRNEGQYREQALREAAAEAQRKAQALASAMGVRLGPIYSISESGVSIIQPVYQGGISFRTEAATPTPILPGETQVRASVTVVYIIQ
jgi:uncharacterized protein YggE